ncbi:MAG: MarR family transcriptional regulator [Clostridia bacterium]|nr:MarR family transcriptional regulator [Clostridia bacterium]
MSEFSQQLSDRLSEVYLYVSRLEETALSKSGVGLTLSELHLLGFIYNFENACGVGEGIKVSEIADGMNIARPSATVAVKKLASKGYVKKQSDLIDGRVTTVTLTTIGRKVYNLQRGYQSAVVEKLEKEFNEDDKRILLRAISRLSDYFKTFKKQ